MSNEKQKEFYNFYLLAKEMNKYSPEDLEQFKHFERSVVVNVPGDQKILVRNFISDKSQYRYVLGRGLRFINPLYEEYIRVPNPSNDITIDWKYSDEQDKENNFTFIPGYNIPNYDGDKDEVYCDYKITVKIIDPIQYFDSSNVIGTIRNDLVGILREFVAIHTKQDLISNAKKYGIDDIDFNHVLEKYERECGLRVCSIAFDEVVESKAVREARARTAEEREAKQKAEARRERKRIETETDIERYNSYNEIFDSYGFSPEQKAYLLGKVITNDSVKGLKDSGKANVFVSMNDGMSMDSRIDPRMFFARHGEYTGNINKLDSDAVDEEVNIDENTKKRRR